MTSAQPVEVFNYYAYGMMIPGFFSNATPDYRFGFNGMLRDDDVRDEKLTNDNEGRGNSYDFGARILDPRVGRFLSLDPLMGSFPWQSPYVFAGNDPIRFIDEDGLFKKKFSKKEYKTLAKIVDQAHIYAMTKSGNPKIINSIYNSLKYKNNNKDKISKKEITVDLTKDHGPEIIVTPLGAGNYGFHVWGDEIQISKTYADLLENPNIKDEEKIQLATFLLYTLYHEYIHVIEQKKGLENKGEERTEKFEKESTGEVLNNHNGNIKELIEKKNVNPVIIDEKQNPTNDKKNEEIE